MLNADNSNFTILIYYTSVYTITYIQILNMMILYNADSKNSTQEANGRLKEWRETLEGKELRISRSVTEYIDYRV